MKKIRIGLVDDHQLFLDGLIRLLEQEDDFEIVFSTTKAINLLDKLNDVLIDILIVDISMPDINGLELIHKIRDQFFLGKIIVISSYANSIDKSCVDAALLKEVSKKELFETIKSVHNETYKKHDNVLGTTSIFSSFLSKREKEIVNLIAIGLTVHEMADKTFLSKHTIETHKKNIFLKLEVTNNAELIKKAMMLGIIEL
ncbi:MULTISPECIES: response regulator transcription factor [Empedobacter]|uniref:Response regulator transcription factor n=1 Tax=Empedobacter falsenii TaxID=343874 RepID=A0A7H9DWZ2_9FLAO|nr:MULTISPECIES: response regulator transcription factor [Empedobacter]QLL59694.1 response regulator transcription factor [Empedobacter falsenii]